ncbi:MAG TPA: lysylphosphatidylglycerol synthase transmembrane domain-containing protein, partial [Candidatus Paceibacterota bacterium]|nr:lysylphosphatidylglycerol synthase transmembrane domain-containing protein [Candidatus Paceibacterota bacterium]
MQQRFHTWTPESLEPFAIFVSLNVISLSHRQWICLRAVCIAISIAALAFLVHRIHAKALAAAFHTMRPGMFLAATMLFGALFVPAALRWRVALRANGVLIRLPAAYRVSLIGHFCYTVLFGVAGGDTAKSALYSRWQQLPLTTVLAASSLDRLLGSAGVIAFTSLAITLGASHGNLRNWGSVSLRWPVMWLALPLVAIPVLWFWLKRSGETSPQVRFVKSLSASAQCLVQSPWNFLLGLSYAVAVQVALSGMLALCLAAVSTGPVPWTQLAWTFPVITIISALPVTFAGLGVRDSAAIALLGMFHVPASTAVAASLLAAAINLIWAAIGAVLLWRESIR